MRTLVRKNATYADYAAMIDWCDINVPFAIYEARYNDRLGQITISFWDSDYIPKAWEQWVVRPKAFKSEKPGISEEYEEEECCEEE